MEGNYILVKLPDTFVSDAVGICKEIQELVPESVAIIVRKGSRWAETLEYTGEFYSTPQANERIMGGK